MSLREVTFLGKDHSCHLTLMALQTSQQGLRKEGFRLEGSARAEVQVRLKSAAREELPVSGKPNFSDNPTSFSQ